MYISPELVKAITRDKLANSTHRRLIKAIRGHPDQMS